MFFNTIINSFLLVMLYLLFSVKISINSDIDEAQAKDGKNRNIIYWHFQNISLEVKTKKILEFADEMFRTNKGEISIIRFDHNSHTLSHYGNEVIERILSTAQNNGKCIKVIGHADKVGGTEINKVISRKRAEAVKNKLVSEGINAQRITIDPQGELNPPVNTPDGKREPENRRVEILIGDCDDVRADRHSTDPNINNTAGGITSGHMKTGATS